MLEQILLEIHLPEKKKICNHKSYFTFNTFLLNNFLLILFVIIFTLVPKEHKIDNNHFFLMSLEYKFLKMINDKKN